jgi:hypothetical protein
VNINQPEPQTPVELLSHACGELRRRLQAGESVSAEEYLSRYPALAADPDRAVDLILCEYQIRRDLGQDIADVDCCERFPQWRSLLQRQRDASTPMVAAGDPSTVAEPATAGSDEILSPGRHTLLEPLGFGGMGVVYKAQDLALDRLVALKMVKSGATDGPEVQRFYREARAVARLRHPHIVPIYAIGSHNGHPCFTMPLIQGGTLAGLMTETGQNPKVAARLLEKVARAVQAAHEAGVIHRDLKPANILLDAGEPLVADFGLARLVDGDEPTQLGDLLGTPAYMAPEQAAGQPVSKAADIWSLGVILYQLLTGRRPFEGRTSAIVWAVRHQAPQPPCSLRSDLPQELETIVLKCLQREPDQRYRSAADLADDLSRWLQGERILARRPSWWSRTKTVLASRRVRRLLALGLLLITSTLAAWLLPQTAGVQGVSTPPVVARPTRTQALAALYADLDAGRPAILIDHVGQERWYRWATERDVPPLQRPVVNYRPLKSLDLVCLCELLPDPRHTSYLLSADIQFPARLPLGRAGIYFLAEERVRPEGPWHRYLVLDLAMVEKKGGTEAEVRFGLAHFTEPTPTNISAPSHYWVASRKLPGLALQEWHTLSVAVAPEGVTVSYDGNALKALPHASLDHQIALREQHLGPRLPPLNRRGRLGVFVSDGIACFRNVVLTPLPAP